MHKFIVRCALAGAIAVGVPGIAFAHAHLETAVPAENGTVATAPSVLDLHFSEELNQVFSGVKVTSANGDSVSLGKSSLSSDKKTLTVPVKGKLAPGAYTVTWHALSDDGHKTKGTYTFTVAP